MPKIVMIDDDTSFLGMVKTLLEGFGWAFHGASDGASGLKLVAEQRPDVILLDVNLPDASGFDIGVKLKNDPSLRDTPLLLISGDKRQAEDILKGLQSARADAYCVKPVHPMVLKAKLEAVMRPYGK